MRVMMRVRTRKLLGKARVNPDRARKIAQRAATLYAYLDLPIYPSVYSHLDFAHLVIRRMWTA